MHIIVGLGNPGAKYKHTRHNVGFMSVDALLKQHGLTWQFNKKFNAEIAKTQNIIFIKPQTFMNNSGQAVQAVLSYYKFLPCSVAVSRRGLRRLLFRRSPLPASPVKRGERRDCDEAGGKSNDLSDILTVIHDDLDIELGKYKISLNSRSAGHKGVESIINHLKTKNFKRIRIGIRTEMAKKIPAEKFVLQKFNEEEIKIINDLIPKIIVKL